MRKVIIYKGPLGGLKVFGSVKKAHRFAIQNDMPVFRCFAEFNRWLEQDRYYSVGYKNDRGVFEVHSVE